MAELFALAAAVLAAVAFRRAGRRDLEQRIGLLEQQLGEVRAYLRAATRPAATVRAAVAPEAAAGRLATSAAPVPRPAAAPPMSEDVFADELPPASPPPTQPVEPPRQRVEPEAPVFVPPARDEAAEARRARWAALRAQAQANWTGILGSVILVLGIAFFGVLASLRIGPEGRFGVIVGAGVLLFAGARWLLARGRLEVWQQFATWLQAAAGAVVLFACAAASAVDGLRFIEAPLPALALLGAGIAVNLGLAYATRLQHVAALHVVLSLGALAVMTPTMSVLPIGAVVALAGIGLSLRERWDVNLLSILVAFAGFHAAWLDRVASSAQEARPYGLPCALLVVLAAALVHYRETYRTTRFEGLPFAVHLLNWTLFGVNVVRYATGSAWAIPALAAGAVVAMALARLGRRRGIRWLYVTDTLVGHVLLLAALARLDRVDVPRLDVAVLAFLELAAFHAVAVVEREGLVARVLYAAEWLAVVAVFGFAIDASSGAEAAFMAPSVAARLAVVAVVVFAEMHLLGRRGLEHDSVQYLNTGAPGDPAHPSLRALAAAPLALVPYLAVMRLPWAAPAMTAAMAALVAYRRGYGSRGFDLGCLAAAVVFHALAWLRLVELKDAGVGGVLLAALPLLALDVAALGGTWLWSAGRQRFLTRSAVYLLAPHVAMTVYAATNVVSDFVPGVAYLVLSVVAVEIASLFRRRRAPDGRPDKRLDELALHAGYFFLALALGRHVVVHLQSEASLGFLSARFAVELLTLGVLLYWLGYAPAIERSTASLVSRVLTPYLWEVALLFLALTAAVELDPALHPAAWSAIACGLYAFARRRRWPPRIAYESWLFLVAGAVDLAVETSTLATPALSWYARPEIVGWIAVALQIAYVASVYRGDGYPPPGEAPAPLAALQTAVGDLLRRRRDRIVLYPVIVGLAMFLFWRYDKALLTLLWVGEIFVVFALGIFLREKHFLRVALGCLALCLARLIGYDLAQSNLAVRAGVFVGVGLLMLAINALYRRFRSRIPD
jgi:hypothetical protein